MHDSYPDLKKHIDRIKIIDTHEHLPSEEERISQPVDVLSQFFIHYTSSDLISAGMPEEELRMIRDPSLPLEDRWDVFEPWWEMIQNTGYSRCMEIAARDLYGVDGINHDTYMELSKKIAERNKPGLYRWVLKEKAGIDISILDPLTDNQHVDRDFFAPVLRVGDFVTISNRYELEVFARKYDTEIHSFSDLVSLVKNLFICSTGIVGIKIAQAYRRSLYFEKRTSLKPRNRSTSSSRHGRSHGLLLIL